MGEGVRGIITKKGVAGITIFGLCAKSRESRQSFEHDNNTNTKNKTAAATATATNRRNKKIARPAMERSRTEREGVNSARAINSQVHTSYKPKTPNKEEGRYSRAGAAVQ